MTATFRRSRARKLAERIKKKAARRSLVEPAEETSQLPPGYFTPASPEPSAFYNFIEDWNRGVVPSNAKLLKFLDSWQTSPILTPDNRLSNAGRALVSHLRELGAILAKAIRERSHDELIQRFVGHLCLAGRIIKQGQRSGRVTLIEDLPHGRRFRIFGRRDAQIRTELLDRRNHMKKDPQDLLTLGQLMISSPDFCSVIIEMQTLIKRAISLKPRQQRGKDPIAGQPVTTPSAQKAPPFEVEDYDAMHRQVYQTREQVSEMRAHVECGVPVTSSIGAAEQRVPSMEFYSPRPSETERERGGVSALGY